MNILLTATEGAAAGGQLIGMFAVYAVLIGAMWFFLMRPQKKEQKRVASMLASLEIGDAVLTSAGFYGVVIDINDDMLFESVRKNSAEVLYLPRAVTFSARIQADLKKRLMR